MTANEWGANRIPHENRSEANGTGNEANTKMQTLQKGRKNYFRPILSMHSFDKRVVVVSSLGILNNTTLSIVSALINSVNKMDGASVMDRVPKNSFIEGQSMPCEKNRPG